MSAAKLRALADKAVWAAAAGSMTELMPDDVRMLREAADALDGLIATQKDTLRIAKAASIGVAGNVPRIARAEKAIANAGGAA